MNLDPQSPMHPDRSRWLVVSKGEVIAIYPSWQQAFRATRGRCLQVMDYSEYKRKRS